MSGEEVWKIEFGNRHIWCWPNRQLSVANRNWCSATIWKCRYAAWKKGLLINFLHFFTSFIPIFIQQVTCCRCYEAYRNENDRVLVLRLFILHSESRHVTRYCISGPYCQDFLYLWCPLKNIPTPRQIGKWRNVTWCIHRIMPAYSILLYFCTAWPKKRDVRNSWLSLDSSTRKIKKDLLTGSGWTGSGSWMTVGMGGRCGGQQRRCCLRCDGQCAQYCSCRLWERSQGERQESIT